ncbi:MAG: hypothetical protein MGG11_15470 [Trichodesmium sp. MAG_R03]|nr:hypothetical protein [Trichodesmium sp. MAG_R03]
MSFQIIRTYAELLYLVGVNGCLPLRMVYIFTFCVSPDDHILGDRYLCHGFEAVPGIRSVE